MEIGGLCVMGATKSTISSVVEMIMLRKIITALILKLIPSIVKHALNNLFTRFVTITLLQPCSQGFSFLISGIFRLEDKERRCAARD